MSGGFRSCNLCLEELIFDPSKQTCYSLVRYASPGGGQWITLSDIKCTIERVTILENEIDQTKNLMVVLLLDHNADQIVQTILDIESIINWNIFDQNTTMFGRIGTDQKKVIENTLTSCYNGTIAGKQAIRVYLSSVAGLYTKQMEDFRTNLFGFGKSADDQMLRLSELKAGTQIRCDILLNHIEFHQTHYLPMWYIQSGKVC